MRYAAVYAGKKAGETAFAEMLALELEEAGITASFHSSGERMKEDILGRDVLSVVSLGDATSDSLVTDLIGKTEARGVILYGKEDVETVFPYFRRPFPVEDFLALAKDVFFRDRDKEPEDTGKEPGIVYDENEGIFLYNGETIRLSEREKALLLVLYRSRGNAVTRKEIRERVFSTDNDTNVADVYISYLRRKIDERFGIKTILTVRNSGYMLK